MNMKVMKGNEAAAYVSYAFTEVAGIYPITPSSDMAEFVDIWAATGKKNLFGQEVSVVEMQSEGGASATMHGSLQAGALTTSYTASQGLLLMIPSMFKMAGELLPGVLHVSARALASHALSIFGDHSDVMAVRQTGFAMLASSGVQEVMHLGAVAHLAAIKGRVPFIHFFDGFRTSHEAQKIEVIDYADFEKLIDKEAIAEFRKNALNPEHPVLRGTAQNPDIFFQAREANNPFYEAIPEVVEKYMNEINKITGRDYKLFNYYGAPDADRVIIAMGSSCECIAETIDYLNAQGEKVGLVTVHLYRPFSAKHFLSAIPDSVKKIAVLDRTKEPGSLGEPLYQDVCTAFFEKLSSSSSSSSGGEMPTIVGGRYGLGSKDVHPAQIAAVYENLKQATPKNHFTVGINDDVSNTSITVGEYLDTVPEGTYSAKFWGIGADGTVGANENSIKIIGEHTDNYAQAYFSYDSKKSGGVTQSHLRFGKKPIRSTYLVKMADFVACHNPSYVDKYDMVKDLKPNGTFLLSCLWSDEELDKKLPAQMKRELAKKNIKFYVVNAVELAKEIGLGRHINTILQAAFFKITNIIPIEDAISYMKKAVDDTYGGRKDQKVVDMNYAAIDAGVKSFREVQIPAEWANAPDTIVEGLDKLPKFIREVHREINALRGELLPVSAFKGREDGTFPQGTSAYEKRGVAIDVPRWKHENCIQCNFCSYTCPHATIRPFLLNPDECKDLSVLDANGKEAQDKGYKYRIQISPLDCYGCGVCTQICPGKQGQKALVLEPIESRMEEAQNWNYLISLPHKENPFDKYASVKNSQFELPLLEFSGACAGCGETPYPKLITQLFGDRLYIGNATGCSSIWGGSAPSTPYTTNAQGKGPAWANSLFEDTAEFTMGLHLAVKQRRKKLLDVVTKIVPQYDESDMLEDAPDWLIELQEAGQEWIDAFNDGEKSKVASERLRQANKDAIARCGSCGCQWDAMYKYIEDADDMLVKKSVWAFGGDGWAYDIGYGGLDHVIASGEDINLLVMDTEVYSNTGGQSSKASPYAAVAKFAASGKKMGKKDLGQMAISYGNVYVAQIAMGADYAQTLKAIKEAEAYPGPSIVIAYATCINHGVPGGPPNFQLQMKRAVAAGYWHLYRYNPLLAKEGKNPFTMDSKEPTESFQDFISGEARYAVLKRQFPEIAAELFEACEKDANRRRAAYKRLAGQ
ncbi:MAG: pyruvate:ferredoxin (flavodoxin) oxidoreductase [Defluviitaleaceae bacterium]|nr:pyruvate:ferredoxin (flavodoxin) oxidoreductase [Defluviitaleaceae bacterium]